MRRCAFALVGFLCLTMKLFGMGLPTAEVAVIGRFDQGPIDLALTVNEVDFKRLFGSASPENFPAEVQALQFFRNGGEVVSVVRIDPGEPLAIALKGSLTPPGLRGLGALLPLSNLGLLICPELTTLTTLEMAACLAQLEVLGEGCPLFTLLDPPPGVTTSAAMLAWRNSNLPTDFSHAAIYFPKLEVDPATWSGGNSLVRLTTGASGTVAAMIQKYDASRGVWKAPAGSSATLLSEGLTVALTDGEIDDLNPAGINSLRDIAGFGQIAWGARTLNTQSEMRYLPVARTRRWILRSLERELSDAALRSNDLVLWANLQQRAAVFLNDLFRQGAFAGESPSGAYFAKCDIETTTPGDVAGHRVNVIIGCAFLRTAEFVVDTIVLGSLDEAQAGPEIPFLVSHPVDGVMHLRFPSVPGFVHRLQISSSLQSGSWFSGIGADGDGSWVTLEYPFGSPNSTYFRVETVPGWEAP